VFGTIFATSSFILLFSARSKREASNGRYFPTGDTSEIFRLFASALRSYLIPHKSAKIAVFHDLEAFRAGAEPSWNSPNPISPTIFAALSVAIYGFCEWSSTASPELEYLYGLVKHRILCYADGRPLSESFYMRKNRSVFRVNLRYYIRLIRDNKSSDGHWRVLCIFSRKILSCLLNITSRCQNCRITHVMTLLQCFSWNWNKLNMRLRLNKLI